MLKAVVALAAVWMLHVSAGCGAGARGPGVANLDERIGRLAAECDRQNPAAPWLTPEEFVARAGRGGWSIVDVRTPRERSVSVIPGAESSAEFEFYEPERAGQPVLVYCTAGCRSGEYTVELRERGIEAYNLRGGVLAWARSGREFVTPEGATTRRVHVFAKRWNALPAGHEPVW